MEFFFYIELGQSMINTKIDCPVNWSYRLDRTKQRKYRIYVFRSLASLAGPTWNRNYLRAKKAEKNKTVYRAFSRILRSEQ